MPFDYSDLEPREMARLALEYVRETASWFEQAPGESVMGSEATHVLTAVAESSRTFSHDLVELLDGYIGHDVAARKDIEARRSFAQRPIGNVHTIFGLHVLNARFH